MKLLEGISRDTTLDAERVHIQALRRLGESGRAQRAFELSAFVRDLSEAGIRERHPAYNEKQVRLAAARLALGDEVFCQIYPQAEV